MDEEALFNCTKATNESNFTSVVTFSLLQNKHSAKTLYFWRANKEVNAVKNHNL